MSIVGWIKSIDDEYLIQWANKGIFRRGQKLLDKITDQDWRVNVDAPTANIESYEQSLVDSNFESLRCDCSSVGPCAHLMCFLLGLRIQFKDLASDDNQKDHNENLLSVKVDIDSADIGRSEIEGSDPPWIIRDDKERLKALGKSHIDQALRWIDQGIEAEIIEDAKGLKALINGRDQMQLLIPRQGGLKASLCQCNEDRCAHRALTLLQIGYLQGFISPSVINNQLDCNQAAVVEQLHAWTNTVVESRVIWSFQITNRSRQSSFY